MPQNGPRLARVVIAVVIEEDNLAADLFLQAASGLEFGEEEALGEDSAGLLAEADDSAAGALAGGCCHTAGAWRAAGCLAASDGTGSTMFGGAHVGDPSSAPPAVTGSSTRVPNTICSSKLIVTHKRHPIPVN